MYADYIEKWKASIKISFDKAEAEILSDVPTPDIVGPDPDPDKCICGGSGWIEQGDGVPRRQIQRTPRIGVSYAKHWADKPLRYLVNPDIFKSRTVMRTVL